MPYFGSFALISLSLSTCVIVPARPVASGSPFYAAYGNIHNPLEVTIDVYSGVENPTWTVHPSDKLHRTIFSLLQWHESTTIPPIMGYRGFKVFCSADGGTDLRRTIGADSNVDLESLLLLTGLSSNQSAALEIVTELLCEETNAKTFCKDLPKTSDTTSPSPTDDSSSTKTEPAVPTNPTSFVLPSTTNAFITAIAGSVSSTISTSTLPTTSSSATTISTSTLPTTASSSTTISTSTLPTTPVSFSPEATVFTSQPTSPSTQCNCPKYEPSRWNSNVGDKINNNCYNYATNTKIGTYSKPGLGSGKVYTDLTGKAVEYAAIRDGLKVVNNPEDVKNGRCLVALLIWPGKDFHWLRRDANGNWSHKRGETAVSNKDDSQKIITDPKKADLGNYKFVTFMNYCPGQITVKK